MKKIIPVNLKKKEDIHNLSGRIVNIATGSVVDDQTSFKFSVKFNGTNSTEIVPEVGKFRYIIYASKLGKYDIEAVKDGYMKAQKTVEVTKDNVNDPKLLDIDTYELLKPNQIRAILNWEGKKVADLDSSLWKIKAGIDGKEVIDYSNLKSKDGTASLYIGKENQKRPESITFEVKKGESYKYFINNSSNEASIALSNAFITIYEGSKEPRTITIPKTGKGRIWNVFDVENGEIKLVSKFQDTYVRRNKLR